MWLTIKARFIGGNLVALYNYDSDYTVDVMSILPAKYKKEIADTYKSHMETMNHARQREIIQDPTWSRDFEVNIITKEVYSRVIESLFEVNRAIRFEISANVYNQVSRGVQDLSYWVNSIKKEMDKLETGRTE